MVHQIYLGLEEDESFGYVETIDNHLLQSNPAKKESNQSLGEKCIVH